MRDFRQYLEKLPELQNFLKEVCGYQLVQAVFAEPDPAWQLAWRLRGAEHLDGGPGLIRDAVVPGDRDAIFKLANTADIKFQPEAEPGYDYHWYPGAMREALNTTYPLWIRVHMCRRERGNEEFRSQWAAVEAIALKYMGAFKVTLEERPLAVLAGQSSDWIQATTSGALGGFLKDTGSSIYAVTCSHVAAVGAGVSDRRSRLLGVVTHASTLTANVSNQPCRPGGAAVNDMDGALFSDLRAASCGYGGPSSNFGSGQVAQMTGPVSGGPHKYFIGGVGLVQTLRHKGQDYCFRNLFSIRTQAPAPLPLALAIAVAPVPVQGDSGSWIVATGVSPSEWIGMLIGVDLIEGFAVEASNIFSWASKAVGSQLTIY